MICLNPYPLYPCFMIHLAHISLFPIKSLDGVSVSQATVLESGALQGDREFAIADQQGKFVNGKRTTAVHLVRSRFDLNSRTVTLWLEGQEEKTLHLDQERSAIAHLLSAYFGFPVHLIQNTEMGFPDDTESPGPTLISTETLQTVAEWFPDLSVAELRRRLRTNLEVSNAEPFWEERLYTTSDRVVPFQIGDTHLLGVNPCQRCIVPTRDSVTGAAYSNFQKTFSTNRKATLPEWAEVSRFNHFYRLAVNTRLLPTEANKVLQVGDAIGL